MEILCSSVWFLSSLFISFFLLKMSTLVSGNFSVIGPVGPIMASVGEEAELPCCLFPPQSAEHMEVLWLHSIQMVHFYRDEQDVLGDQDSNYQGRTTLVRDAIETGNITLKIQDVRLLDAGKYKCIFEDNFQQAEAIVELKVFGEEVNSRTQPPKFFTNLLLTWILLFLMFMGCMVFFLVYFHRSAPWIGYISGILVLTCTTEIGAFIYYLWIRHRCRGFLYKEVLMWKDWKLVGAVILMALTQLISILLQMKFFCKIQFQKWKMRRRTVKST